MTFRFDVYHRFQLDVGREQNAWRVYRVGNEGKRRLDPSIVIPPSLAADQLLGFLDDLLHEYATPSHPELVALPPLR